MAEVPVRAGHVLHERASHYHWQGAGLTSIKSFYGGSAQYALTSGTQVVDATRYLVLNHEQPYSITIDDAGLVESFCVFFEPHSLRETAQTLTAAEDELLDDPFATPYHPVEFLDITYRHDKIISPRLAKLRQHYDVIRDDDLWMEEQLYGLMHALLVQSSEVATAMRRVQATRASTREELFRRVSLAEDIIRSEYRKGISLAELSQMTALSPNHLIRTYKQVFGDTPHQHVISLRLAEAKRLLSTTDRPILEICLSVGREGIR